MPIYDYDCAACGRRFEVIHGVHAEGPAKCELCGGGPVRKAVTAAAVHYRGSGWAKKERRSAGASKAGTEASADAAGSDGANSDRSGSDRSGTDGGDVTPGGADKPARDGETPAKPSEKHGVATDPPRKRPAEAPAAAPKRTD